MEENLVIKPLGKSKKSKLIIFFEKLNSQKTIQIMALLGAIWSLIFVYIPMRGIYIAFSDYNILKPIFSSKWAGLKYFKEFLTDPNVILVLKNTLGISLLGIVIAFPLPIIFSLLLNELTNAKFKRFVQTVSYLPHFISWVILGGFLITWTSETGFINEILMKLNLIKEPIYLLGEAKYFWGVAITSGVWKELGWGAILYLASIASINTELYDAATVDGANRFRRMWHVTLPGMRTTISILLIFAISGVLNSNFDQIFVMKNPLNSTASDVIDIYVYRMGIQLSRFSYATAVGLLKSVIALILLLIANKASHKLTETSFI